MFNFKLMELEAELLARSQSERGLFPLPPECQAILQFVERQIEVLLENRVPSNWCGWLSYRHGPAGLIICRGRAFADGIFGVYRAGLDVVYGIDTVHDYQRHFDVSPPQDLDHLLLNFGNPETPMVYLWYGENLVPYRLIYEARVSDDPHLELIEAIFESLTWILTRPKEVTLAEFLQEIASKNRP